MNRAVAIVLLSLALFTCLYVCIFRWVTDDAASAMKAEHPELEWLRYEYNLSDEQFSEIFAKHKAHDIICRELCQELVTVQNALDEAITENPEVNSAVSEAISSWISQRERCREATILHMYEVSRVMSEEDGARYRKRIFDHLIAPGRMPHISKNGEFHEELIEHAAPHSIESSPSGE
ncbi:MAG: hypothetical protein CMO55_17555 [Verrucomicrobiales bacterium]|nr:hypothetical protein [Verrucomicrobiales bacterium]